VSSSSELVVAPAPLQHRLQALRNKRMASRFSGGIKLAAWTAVFAAGLVVVGGGLLNGH
jgi:anti-sigma factor RsiW